MNVHCGSIPDTPTPSSMQAGANDSVAGKKRKLERAADATVSDDEDHRAASATHPHSTHNRCDSGQAQAGSAVISDCESEWGGEEEEE